MSFLERLKESLVPCTPSVRKKSFFWTKNRRSGGECQLSSRPVRPDGELPRHLSPPRLATKGTANESASTGRTARMAEGNPSIFLTLRAKVVLG
jgi:hypothetical protein